MSVHLLLPSTWNMSVRYSELSPLERFKANVRGKAKMRLYRGQIKKQSCLECGRHKTQMHHDNYFKPYDVIFLCNIHHRHRDKLFSKCPISKVIEKLYSEYAITRQYNPSTAQKPNYKVKGVHYYAVQLNKILRDQNIKITRKQFRLLVDSTAQRL